MAADISIDPQVTGGVPCVAGTRIPVATVIGLLGQGMSIEQSSLGLGRYRWCCVGRGC
ncbi:DUF433 domain-containing protein [Phytohabitans sp. LJ34]|uniref:DUF433 domain-containing protein n=1 Tax=Phytohabitans sp. LJ34 TaxID=3452217 RepID=UPI003F8A5B0E